MMQAHIEKLLEAKALLDSDVPQKNYLDRWILNKLIAQGMLSPGWSERSQGQRKVINGKAFAQAALPFCDPHYSREAVSVTPVPSRAVLAGAYSNVPLLNPEAAAELADTLDSHSVQDDRESAHYVQLGAFPLYVASEGKHRVSLYRQLKRKIIARVHKSSYPTASELELVRLRPFGIIGLRYLGTSSEIHDRICSWQSVKINQHQLAVLTFTESVEVLRAYGVPWGKPSLSLVAGLVRRQAELYVAHSFYIR